MAVLHEPLQFVPDAAPAAKVPGTVTLVGAGPGDPELLTVRAARALRQARLVLYDHLVSREVLDLLPSDADRLYVGKESGHHTLPQEGIIDCMVRLAQQGRSLVRLKGGDCYIFGRGGEVVPGISAAQGAAAAAGIPLTHRDHAATLVLTTGHMRAEAGEQGLDLDWPMLARPKQTVVVYMGVSTLPQVCAQLVAHGLPAGTPAAVIEKATLPTQRTICGTLSSLPALAAMNQVRSPALIVVGSVVSLHAALAADAGDRRAEG